MARKYRWTLPGLLVGVLACGDPAGPAASRIPLTVYVTESFQEDHVDIALDGTTVFAATVTTESFCSPAASVYIAGPRGMHRLDMRIENQTVSAEFVLDRPTYVILSRDGLVGELRVRVTHERPLWL